MIRRRAIHRYETSCPWMTLTGLTGPDPHGRGALVKGGLYTCRAYPMAGFAGVDLDGFIVGTSPKITFVSSSDKKKK